MLPNQANPSAASPPMRRSAAVPDAVSRIISRGLVCLIAVLAGISLGRVALLLRNDRLTDLQPRQLLRVPGDQRLILLFQPADCSQLTGPIARMFRQISQTHGGTAIGVMLRAPPSRKQAEAAAIVGGIDFPVLIQDDSRGIRLVHQLGFTSTPIVLVLSKRGELRYARSGGILPADRPLITRLATEDE